MERRLRILVGLLVSAAVAVAPWCFLDRPAKSSTTSAPSLASSLFSYAVSSRQTLVLEFSEPTALDVSDPIFWEQPDGSLRRVGEVHTLLGDNGEVLPYAFGHVKRVRAMFYPDAPPLSADVRVQSYSTPETLMWVATKLLPPDRRSQIAKQFRVAYEEHREAIGAALRPVFERTLLDLLKVVEQDGPPAIERHRAELEALGAKYRREIVEQELTPLVKNQVWPVVHKRVDPELQQIGRELWDRVSLWRFGWRWAVDALPLTDNTRADAEWSRFVSQEALPVLEKHREAFLRITTEVLRELMHNEELRAAATRSMKVAYDDPELRKVMRQIFREVVTDNPRFRAELARHWSDPETQRALQSASSKMEPALREMGVLMLGTPSGGITPEFAQVLRAQILGKDARWFRIEVSPAAGGAPPAVVRVEPGAADE